MVSDSCNRDLTAAKILIMSAHFASVKISKEECDDRPDVAVIIKERDFVKV